MGPRVLKARAVGVGEGEVAVVPEGLAKAREHYLHEACVDVCVNVFFAPLLRCSFSNVRTSRDSRCE